MLKRNLQKKRTKRNMFNLQGIYINLAVKSYEFYNENLQILTIIPVSLSKGTNFAPHSTCNKIHGRQIMQCGVCKWKVTGEKVVKLKRYVIWSIEETLPYWKEYSVDIGRFYALQSKWVPHPPKDLYVLCQFYAW